MKRMHANVTKGLQGSCYEPMVLYRRTGLLLSKGPCLKDVLKHSRTWKRKLQEEPKVTKERGRAEWKLGVVLPTFRGQNSCDFVLHDLLKTD